MPGKNRRTPAPGLWNLAAEQHGVVSRQQLLALGLNTSAIDRRIANGRLHSLMRGVYAVGRPVVGRRGRWIAAVLCCDPRTTPGGEPHAVLSHGSAAALWGIAPAPPGPVQVSVRSPTSRRRPGVKAFRRPALDLADCDRRDGIPVTGIVRTLVDIATMLSAPRLERAVNEADRLDLVDPERLRSSLPSYRGVAGVGRLRELLDRRTFSLTASELERRFLILLRGAGLPEPLTGQMVNGYEVDFFWPGRGLVVETDGLRYHRTPTQQARDRLRDQAHLSAGLTPLRFTHAQVRFEPKRVTDTLAAILLGDG
jgi:very-short-patch-repair endonuclease